MTLGHGRAQRSHRAVRSPIARPPLGGGIVEVVVNALNRSPWITSHELLYQELVEVYGGREHRAGMDGHAGPWRTCDQCCDLLSNAYIALLRRHKDDEQAARTWLLPGRRTATALSEGGRVERPALGLLARPEIAARNHCYRAPLEEAAARGRLRQPVDLATELLAAVLVQIHMRGVVVGTDLADWDKAAAYVAARVPPTGGSIEPEALARLWHDEVAPILHADADALGMLDQQLYRHVLTVPRRAADGLDPDAIDDQLARRGPTGPSERGADEEPDDELAWEVARRLLAQWSDDPRQRVEHGARIVQRLVDEMAGPTPGLDPSLLVGSAGDADDLVLEAVDRCGWPAAAALVMDPPTEEVDEIVAAASIHLRDHLAVVFELDPAALAVAIRSASWSRWVDRVIVLACELKADVRQVRDEFRTRSSGPLDVAEVSERLGRSLRARHGWDEATAAHHLAQTWFAAVVSHAATRPLHLRVAG